MKKIFLNFGILLRLGFNREPEEWTHEKHRAKIQAEREHLNKLFPGNENLAVTDRRILIQRYKDLWLREQYPFGRKF